MPLFLTTTGGATGMTQLLTDIGTTLTSVVGWFGTMVSALVTADGDLNGLFPLLALGIAISICFAGVKIVRSFAWGA